MEEFETELRTKLREFKNQNISGMNWPVDISDGMTLSLCHWVDSRNHLRVEFHIDRGLFSDPPENLSSQSNMVSNYVNHVNNIFEKEGYPRFDVPIFEDQDDIMNIKPYLYTTEIRNPVDD